MDHLIDLHCHTQELSYDGQVPAAEIIRRLVEAEYAGVVFTDHNNVWSAEQLAELRAEAGAPADFVLLSGQEVRCTIDGITAGDLLVYGPQESIADGTDVGDVFAAVHATDGFCIAAHPAVPRIGFGTRAGDYPEILAVEIWNGRYGRRQHEDAMAQLADIHRAWVGGSDTHRPEDIAGGGTFFEERPASLAHLKRLLQEERCAWWRPELSGRIKRWSQAAIRKLKANE